MPIQGTRNDLGLVAQAIMNGETMRDIAVNFPCEFMQYSGGIKAFHSTIRSKPRDSLVAPTVHWWFGRTGVGKSRKAFELYGSVAYRKEPGQWWCGYEGQDVVILDDYRPHFFPFSTLLSILDRYPHRVQLKNSSLELSATTFVITTTSRPEVLWQSQTHEHLDQLIRRITSIVEFLPNGENVLKGEGIPYTPLTYDQMFELGLVTDRNPQKINF